jgi:uncharacterized membrane protein YagU involved in acid resistance
MQLPTEFLPVMIQGAAAVAAIVAGLAASTYGSALRYAVLIWIACWIVLFLEFEMREARTYTTLTEQVGEQLGRIVGLVALALVFHTLRRAVQWTLGARRG